MTLEADGYAFPGTRYSQEGMTIGAGQGMTMRDWFAGQALQGALANTLRTGSPVEFAEAAYSYADAMIEQRNK